MAVQWRTARTNLLTIFFKINKQGFIHIMFDWLTDDARLFLSRGYLRGQKAEDRYREICDTFEKISGIEGFSDKFFNYCEKGWVSFASPVLSNMGTDYGLPASCNFSTVPDSVDEIFTSLHEMAVLAKNSAGTAYNFSNIRPLGASISTGGVSDGVIPWLEIYECAIQRVSQSSLRRGFLTAYLSVDHGDILDFLDVCTPASSIQNITTAVTIPEGWLQAAKDGDEDKRDIFKKILKRRSEIGFPYIYFEDNCNDQKCQIYKDKDMHLNTSNICSETVEYCDAEKTFVCVLSSANLRYYDDWKDTDFIFDLRIALDCVISEYITKAKTKNGYVKAVKFAEEHRSVGIGALGFHDYLQLKNIPFDSFEARAVNQDIFRTINKEVNRSSSWMAEVWGEPKMCEGYGVRSTTNMAIAPTKSSSFIMGMVSLGIEPNKSNYHEKTVAKISAEYKNPYLEKHLDDIGQNTEDIWSSILNKNGSVQHLSFLSQETKDVFKTSFEISQRSIITLAADRQKFIDQAQSLNLMFHPDTPAKDIAGLVFLAHELGLKTLYYQYSISAAEEFSRELVECTSCEG